MMVELEIPVPRGYGYPKALSWAADIFADFAERGWTVRSMWALELGRHGKLTFVAEHPSTVGLMLPQGTSLSAAEVEGLRQRFEVVAPEFSDEARELAHAYDRATTGGKRALLLGENNLHYDAERGWVIV